MKLDKAGARWLALMTLALFLLVVGAGSALAAWECNSGRHCGYNSTGGVNRLYQISGPPGTVIFLADEDRDKTTSGRNRTSNFYCGVNRRLFGDQTVVEYQPGAQFNNAAIANNNIDHYDVRASSGNCHNPIF